MTTPMTPDQLEAHLRGMGAERYHNLHPFHKMLHGGKATPGQVRAWALNRYYYQAIIPIKDSVILSRIKDPDIRRVWRQRVVDHDGEAVGEGGIARWLNMCEQLGLDRDYVVSTEGLLPATRYACDAYVDYVRDNSVLAAIASSLTELFAPDIHKERIAGFLQHYDFANDVTLAYFRKRLDEAPRDVRFGLAWVKENAKTVEQQQQVIHALSFKLDMLWAQLDALHLAYVTPGMIPPGAYIPE
ncbi:Coenzyme PQQ synthesis protein C [Paramagnetospirillum magnetotacticum MS-1]|uniref:Pyrroloquinoline-quinone synthase n=1 Tax=Paramagnetospirillum magnetotacticum MS-1 TaxID=272627 RepID=A0A0C2YIB5_PARME|nr:pyrroloquinoline-quinone synthase PqqC [Paramagnetospirillum magnetotacticum]KIL99484.1 Coenzyme PQQ synthesis protein C [Paramagnetospirillum magnetotacticum MS-1]